MDIGFSSSVLKIVLIDIVLSGDNAVVIALAAHQLPSSQRRAAILAGTGGAIGLRVLFTFMLASLLNIPFLKLAGGVILVGIAIKLLWAEKGKDPLIHPKKTLGGAIITIIMADFVMSLDNMLAVGGASHGHLKLILLGLFLSITLIMTCSSLLARWMDRFRVLIYAGAGVLALTAGEMMVSHSNVYGWMAIGGIVLFVLLSPLWKNHIIRLRSARNTR